MKRAISVCIILTIVLTGYTLTQADDEYDYYVHLPFVVGSGDTSVRILPNHSWYESWSTLRVVGEVQNNTSDNLSWIRVTTNLFSQYGVLIDVDVTYPWLYDLPAGDKTCFRAYLGESWGWDYYEFEPVRYHVRGNPPPNITILEDNGYGPSSGRYIIVGIVRNDHSARVDYVQPVGTLYNASGTVIGCDYTYASATHLDPGEQTSFKITFSGRNYADVASYRLQVGGNAIQTPTSTPPPTSTPTPTVEELPTGTATPTPTIEEMLVLEVRPLTLSFGPVQVGGEAPPSQQIVVVSIGDRPMEWSAETSDNWLSISSSYGNAPSTFQVSVNTAGLIVGSYEGEIIVSGNRFGTHNSPQTVRVALEIAAPGTVLLPTDTATPTPTIEEIPTDTATPTPTPTVVLTETPTFTPSP